MRELLARVASEVLGAELQDYERLTGGAVGAVFRADCGTGSERRRVCIKLVHAPDELPLESEPDSARVYGTRQSNHAAARRALSEAGLPLPRLYGSGSLADPPRRYYVMDYLDGMSVVDWTEAARRDPAGLHALIGATLARLHRSQRAYPGWLDLRPEDAWSFRPALSQTLHDAIARAAEASPQLHAARARLDDFAADAESRFTDPPAFSLGHPDGLQAIATHGDGGWQLLGLIDVEDHLYTDPRFPLAGVDLQYRLRGSRLPSALRAAYVQQRPWPDDFEAARPLYQLLFLCTWTHVLAGSETATRLPERVLALLPG